jgi:hypothetical protein
MQAAASVNTGLVEVFRSSDYCPLIRNGRDENPYAQSRKPMNMMRQCSSTSQFKRRGNDRA